MPRVEVRAAGVTLLVDVDIGGPAVLTVPSSVELPLRGEPVLVGVGRGR